MKKYTFFLLSVIFIFLSINSVNAQIRFGLRGGLDVNEARFNFKVISADNRLGYFIGGTLEAIVPASGFGGEISLLYGQAKYKVINNPTNISLSKYEYVIIPIHIKQRIKIIPNLGVFVSGGPYAEVKIDGLNIQQTVDMYKSKSFAMGLSACVGANILNRMDVYTQFRSELTQRFSDEYMDAGIFQDKKYQVWSVGATFYF